MKFLILMLGALLGFALLSRSWPCQDVTETTQAQELPAEHFSKPLPGDTLCGSIMAYCPYDKCVGDGPYIFPRKTPGGGSAEKIGFGADPKIFPYGTRIKLYDPAMCKFIRETDPNDEDAQNCIVTVDDTGHAAKDATAQGIFHLEFRVPRRTPSEDAHARALSFPRRDAAEIEIISMP